jgi:hypothetical protein
MLGLSFTVITIILSSIILLVLKDLRASLVVTCALKNRRTAWLGPFEGNLASFHD